MADIVVTTNLLFQPIATAVMLVYLYSILTRAQRFGDRRWLPGVIGSLFGVAAVVGMFNPITLAPGILVDARNLYIGAAFGLFGPVAGGITLTMVAAMRVATGGAGMWIGISAMFTSASAGILWRLLIARRPIPAFAKNLGLGLMISSQLTVGLWLPPAARATYFSELAPYLFTLHVVGSFLLAFLVSRETRFQADAEALKVAADTDALTGLLNRRSATKAVQRLAQADGLKAGTAVIVFDVDHFKAINDSNGHAVGDAVLTTITKRISGCLRPGDLFIRLGGDEFAVVMPCTSQGQALSVASRCRQVVSGSDVAINGVDVTVTVSVGVSWTQAPQDLDVLLSAADTALYESKEKGRNTVSLAPCLAPPATRKRHAA